jgi:hypothetical protein
LEEHCIVSECCLNYWHMIKVTYVAQLAKYPTSHGLFFAFPRELLT